jgi:hypothetical protein
MRRILFLKTQMQGKKRSKVGHLARLFNAADAFSGAKYTRKSNCQDALGTRLRGCDRYLVLQKPAGRILESDTCSQNKPRTSPWPMAKRRIQESDLRGWCYRTAFIL